MSIVKSIPSKNISIRLASPLPVEILTAGISSGHTIKSDYLHSAVRKRTRDRHRLFSMQ
jgi:hypothetical protein